MAFVVAMALLTMLTSWEIIRYPASLSSPPPSFSCYYVLQMLEDISKILSNEYLDEVQDHYCSNIVELSNSFEETIKKG